MQFRFRHSVAAVNGACKSGRWPVAEMTADYYVWRCPSSAPAPGAGLNVISPAYEHSPITGVHLWFDRPVTDYRTQHCSIARFNGCSTRVVGSSLQVRSAHLDSLSMTQPEVVALCCEELPKFFPAVSSATLFEAES